MTSAAALGPYSRALALRCKARELQYRGHTERGDDKLREALAAARAVGTEDCLVTAYLTVELAEHDLVSFIRRACEQPDAQMDLPSVTIKVRELAEAVAGAASVARRRRILGTDRPAEHAWYAEYHIAEVCLGKTCSRSQALKSVEFLAPLSSEVAVYAACDALYVLELATHLDLFSASELSRRLGAACDLVDEACPLAMPLRENNTACTSISVPTMMHRLSAGVELWRQERSTVAHAERLAEALKHPLGLNVGMSADLAELLGTLVAKIDEDATKLSEKVAAAQAAASVPELLRVCALASCGAKEAHVWHFSRCPCKTVVYCSKDCQLADWPAHKKACKATRKAADKAKTAAAGSAA